METFITSDQLLEYFQDFEMAFENLIFFIGSAYQVIVSSPVYLVPLLLLTLLFLIFGVIEVLQLLSGRLNVKYYKNPNTVYQNPNKVYKSDLVTWSGFFNRRIISHHKKIAAAKKENEKSLLAYEKLVEEQEALKNKRLLKENNQKLVDEYFDNNPGAFKITKDGETFWRPGWEKMRHGSQYSKPTSFNAERADEEASNAFFRDFSVKRRKPRHGSDENDYQPEDNADTPAEDTEAETASADDDN